MKVLASTGKVSLEDTATYVGITPVTAEVSCLVSRAILPPLVDSGFVLLANSVELVTLSRIKPRPQEPHHQMHKVAISRVPHEQVAYTIAPVWIDSPKANCGLEPVEDTPILLRDAASNRWEIPVGAWLQQADRTLTIEESRRPGQLMGIVVGNGSIASLSTSGSFSSF
jgi:hypothetical protein